MAAAKKDFSKVNTSRMYNTIEEATQLPGQMELQQDGTLTEAQATKKERKTYTVQEAQEAQEALKTQGRKGIQAPRINLAFTPSVYEYIKTMAAVRGETMTEFVNKILQQSLEENKDLYERAKEFKNSL